MGDLVFAKVLKQPQKLFNLPANAFFGACEMEIDALISEWKNNPLSLILAVIGLFFISVVGLPIYFLEDKFDGLVIMWISVGIITLGFLLWIKRNL